MFRYLSKDKPCLLNIKIDLYQSCLYSVLSFHDQKNPFDLTRYLKHLKKYILMF